jgi:hypothetical protein
MAGSQMQNRRTDEAWYSMQKSTGTCCTLVQAGKCQSRSIASHVLGYGWERRSRSKKRTKVPWYISTYDVGGPHDPQGYLPMSLLKRHFKRCHCTICHQMHSSSCPAILTNSTELHRLPTIFDQRYHNKVEPHTILLSIGEDLSYRLFGIYHTPTQSNYSS